MYLGASYSKGKPGGSIGKVIIKAARRANTLRNIRCPVIRQQVGGQHFYVHMWHIIQRLGRMV